VYARADARKRPHVWSSFLDGYTSIRPLAVSDIASVPLFLAIGHVWMMGYQAAKVPGRGRVRASDDFFSRTIDWLREWEATHLTE
jgi:Ser/Thr protein kinase RdoA (MazF antagonist)